MRARWLAFTVALALAGGCGTLDGPPPPDAGRPCVQDSECVPDACCGRGLGAVHLADGPDCAAVRCDGACPLAEVGCGCGLPVCRDSRCTVAWAADPSCG